MTQQRRPEDMTGIVLSGGGARGAYEAGVVSAIVEVLRRHGLLDRAPFDVLSGTSVGAINAGWLAAHADAPDMGVDGLRDNWRRLALDTHLQMDVPGLLGARTALPALARRFGVDIEPGERWGRSVLDARPLERLVREQIPWQRLHANVERGLVRALVVATLEIRTGRTTMFAELAPGVDFRPSRDPRRVAKCEPLSARHVLASAAIPFLFPSRRIGQTFHCDGGLRFNTPIAPAIRCGSRRLVVVSLLHRESVSAEDGEELEREAAYPSPMFLYGKVLNALLLDPVDYDLHVLHRFNRLVECMESTLHEDELQRVHETTERTRGMRYRKVPTLVFRPSEDIGHMASKRARDVRAREAPGSFLLSRFARLGTTWEADLLSFIMFDGAFAEELVDMGRRDAFARENEIARFFAEE